MTTESSSPPLSAPAVAAIIIAEDAELLDGCLAAVERQVYAPAQVLVVGGDDEIRVVAGRHEATWRATTRAVMDSLAPAVGFVWVLRDRARPRADALVALLRDGARVDASVVGSKILDAERPERLVAVGYATDIFDAPYSGLQEDEIDQSQYDVVRDVAAVSGASMLTRRDLFSGLGGVDPKMAPLAASIDFCQRARLRGGRVVVAPSSEVLYVKPDRDSDWRERAGEIRAMLKVYSLVTLLWAVPLAFLTGLVESIASPFLGRWRLFGFLAAWGWNLLHLPSALRARRVVRRGRQVGDEELFRYQTGGSARLRLLWDRALVRVRARFPEGLLAGFSDAFEAGQQRLRRPSFIAGLTGTLFAFVATRSIWVGRLPIVGFSLPPPTSALDALGAYAGGWNPAGLGSPEVLHPSVGATAAVQLLLFGKGGLAVAFLTVGAFLLGIFGTARLLRGWGLSSTSGYLAGIVLMGGSATSTLGGNGQWAPLIALGVVPWVLAAAFRNRPAGFMSRLGGLAAVSVAAGVGALFAPAVLAVAPLAAVVWGIVGVGKRWSAILTVVAGSALAVPLLMPWVLYADLDAFLAAGEAAFWDPGWIPVGLILAAAVGAIIAGDRVVSAVAGWGALLAGLGTVAARSGDFGSGREVETAGLVAVAFGAAAAAGGALELWHRRSEIAGPRFAIGSVGSAAAMVMVAGTLLLLAPGRAGLPQDEYRTLFAFAAAGDEAPSRVLLFGSAADLPGEANDLEGLGYRLVDPPFPRSWDAYLHDPRLGDEALQSFLETLLDGEVRRAGESLADFGIGWVAFMEESPLQSIFEAQLDMLTLRSFDIPVFRNEVPTEVALADDGAAWTPAGTGYRLAGAGSSVRVAVNADSRWGPGAWEQSDWANLVEVEPGTETVSFSGHSPRRMMAIGAGGWLLVLIALAMFGSRRRAS